MPLRIDRSPLTAGAHCCKPSLCTDPLASARTPRWLITLALLAILAGIGLRLTHLDGKLLWHDEAHTALRVSGYSTAVFVGAVFDNRVITRDALLEFQRPALGHGFADTLRALITRPEHGPLYYVAARAGFLFTEDAKLATRGVAALFSLLLLPGVFWLWRELFGGGPGAWIILGLIALSPFQLVYAQEARQYSLWAVMTVAVCAALLRAHRRNDRASWALYAWLVTLGLYTHLMLAVLVAAQALWLAWVARAQWRSFALALLAAVALFSPWLLLFHGGLRDVANVTGWMRQEIPFERLSGAWGMHLVRQFVDGIGPVLAWLPPVLVLLLYGIFRTARSAPVPARRLLFLLLLVTLGSVIGPDLIGGGRRSQEARYLLPAFLVLMFMVAYGLAQALEDPRRVPRILVLSVWMGLLGLGLGSGLKFVQAESWWNKSLSSHNGEVARQIDAAARPLVICQNGDINPGEILSVAHEVQAKTRFLPIRSDYLPELTRLDGEVFLLNPSPALIAHFAAHGDVRELHRAGRLWGVSPRHGSS
ncbi:MAG: glycosyltransferase family 39 protein [Gammaproteobacteria bacterium]